MTYGDIVVNNTTSSINEGQKFTYTINLSQAPTNDQIVNITTTNNDVTVNPTSLTFTSSNYNTPQTVTVDVARDSDTSSDDCQITMASTGVTSQSFNIQINDIDVSEPEVTSYTITKNLTNVTISNSATSVNENSSYSATLTANSGYTLSSVTVTMGGSDITSTSYSNGTVTITKVTGNIIITATATSSSTTPTPTTYTITNTLTNVTTNNSAKTITEGSSYSATLTPTDGYEITSVTVSMGAADVTSTAYSNGNININSVVGNLTIIATATQTSSGTDAPGGYRRLALSDLSIIGDRISGLAINENNEVTVESAAQWDGILVNESIQEMKFTTRATVTSFGDLLWLIYSNNGDGTYNATTLGNSNSKGKKYKFTLPSTSASSIGADNFSVSAGSTVTATISGGNLIIKDGKCEGVVISDALKKAKTSSALAILSLSICFSLSFR